MWPSPQFPADLVTFTEEILNGTLFFLCSVDYYHNEKESQIYNHMMHLPIALTKNNNNTNNTCDKLKSRMFSAQWVCELLNPSLFISCKVFNCRTWYSCYNKYFWKGNVSTSWGILAETNFQRNNLF